MGYFDWPGVIPHHYLVANYTARLSQAIDIMTTFPGDNVIAYSYADCLLCHMCHRPWSNIVLRVLSLSTISVWHQHAYAH